MKRFFAVITLIACCGALQGCGAFQTKITAIESDIVTKTDQAITFPDIDNALVGAQQLPEPQRTEAITCLNEEKDYLHQVEVALTPPSADATTPPAADFNPLQPGFATAAIDVQLAAASTNVDPKALLLAKVPPAPRQTIKDCLIVFTDSKIALGKVGLSAGALALSFGDVAAAVKLKKAGTALSREAAKLGAH